MSTRSNIGIEDPETGAVRAIYCHSDGYLEGVGKTLLEHWTDRAKIEALIALGSISSLGEELGERHDFDYWLTFYEQYKSRPDEDMYADPEFQRLNRMCNAFGRDRGEKDVEAEDYADPALYYAAGGESWAEYLYLYRRGVWLYAEPGGAAGPMIVRADDPDGSAEERWRSVAGMLALGEKPRSYSIGG